MSKFNKGDIIRIVRAPENEDCYVDGYIAAVKATIGSFHEIELTEASGFTEILLIGKPFGNQWSTIPIDCVELVFTK